MVANSPPSSTDLLLYKGYLSFLVTVLDTNARGYRSEHFPSIMRSEFGFARSMYHIFCHNVTISAPKERGIFLISLESLAIKTYFSHSADENMRAQIIITSWVVPECKTILIM
ncbi:unnamed protein product [Onchocerca ochengi]|uniref:COE1_DBD domain-containing protein n=1 Tax=Onchocerca ochengi TaxID=42157 RepID=A0A182E314_ONCOC|nr:unnamed protein product [Onchocerca ochengi]